MCVCLCLCVKNYFGLIGYYATRSETFSFCGIPTIFDSATRKPKKKKLKTICIKRLFVFFVFVYKLMLQFSTYKVSDKPTYIQV